MAFGILSHLGHTQVTQCGFYLPRTDNLLFASIMSKASQQVVTKAVRAIQSILPQKLPPTLDTRAANLYKVLGRHPNDGVGLRVSQTRWGERGISNSYWLVTRSKLKCEGQHGKAWGKLHWKGGFRPSKLEVPLWKCATLTRLLSGKLVTKGDERIPGSLKYKWRTGPSIVSPAFRRKS